MTMPPDLVVHAATGEDAGFIFALRGAPDTHRPPRVHRMHLEVFGDNHAAQRAFERAGFRREGSRWRAYWRRDAWQDGVHYGLLADERSRVDGRR